MHEINTIRIAVYNKIKEYLSYKKDIKDEQKLYTNLGIYGDSMEEIIHELANILNFNEYKFWEIFIKNGYCSPGEVDVSYLPKIFFLDIKGLFKGEINYLMCTNNKYITIKELILLINDLLKAEKTRI